MPPPRNGKSGMRFDSGTATVEANAAPGSPNGYLTR